MPSVSQRTDVQGQSCGACAASYVLEELLHLTFTKEDVENLWKRVQFGTAPEPGFIEADHTDPTKLLNALRRAYPELNVAGYMAAGCPLARYTSILADPSVVQDGDPMEYLIANPTWRVIGIYKTDGLHYVVTMYGKGRYHLRDSNASVPKYVPAPEVMRTNVPFSAPLDGGTESYTYLGAGILVHL